MKDFDLWYENYTLNVNNPEFQDLIRLNKQKEEIEKIIYNREMVIFPSDNSNKSKKYFLLLKFFLFLR